MISRRTEVYQFAQINSILEEKFGDDPWFTLWDQMYKDPLQIMVEVTCRIYSICKYILLDFWPQVLANVSINWKISG